MHFQSEGSGVIKVKGREAARLSPRAGQHGVCKELAPHSAHPPLPPPCSAQTPGGSPFTPRKGWCLPRPSPHLLL